MSEIETGVVEQKYFNEQELKKILNRILEPDWMRQLRRDALAFYRVLPFPSTQEEDWRRTNISHIDFESFKPYDKRGSDKRVPGVKCIDDLSGVMRFEGSACLDGQVQTGLEQQGVIFTTLTDALLRFPELVKKYLMQSSIKPVDGKFQAMHGSFWTHGVFLYVPKFLEIAEPFLAIFEEIGDQNASVPHILVIVEEGAHINFRHEINSQGSGGLFRNAIVNLYVANAAALNYIEVQQLNEKSINISNGWAKVGKDAELYSLVANFGSTVTKATFGSGLHGPGANARLRGLYFADNHQHIDQQTVQFHEVPHTTSNLRYKGAVKDRAHTIYQGVIKVFPDAQQTDAYQSNKNLVLNNHARADSIPGLEIEANDVKCSHGSTVGKVNEEEIFYLMSRGLSREDAKKMIVSGFFKDVLIELPTSVQKQLGREIENKLTD